ncbi:hypothetical protein EPN90_00470 [Patescibacteria group bacterium]|nr:MAG: hypothetical protein EPN90_00470 [Patescibacteria group bacterium]
MFLISRDDSTLTIPNYKVTYKHVSRASGDVLFSVGCRAEKLERVKGERGERYAFFVCLHIGCNQNDCVTVESEDALRFEELPEVAFYRDIFTGKLPGDLEFAIAALLARAVSLEIVYDWQKDKEEEAGTISFQLYLGGFLARIRCNEGEVEKFLAPSRQPENTDFLGTRSPRPHPRRRKRRQ